MNDWNTIDKIRVLAVEDNPADQEILRREMKSTQLSNSILFTADPQAALDMIQNPSFKLKSQLVAMLLDLHLPRMNGLEFLKIIRSIQGLEELPVILMTTSPSPETVRKCRDLGVLAIVDKPLRLSALSSTLAQIFHQPPVTV